MISLEQDFEQSLERALAWGAVLDRLGDTGCARRSGALRAEPVALSQAKPPAAIAEQVRERLLAEAERGRAGNVAKLRRRFSQDGSNDNGR